MSWGIYQVGWVNLDIERDIVSVANYDDIHAEGQPRDAGAPGELSTGYEATWTEGVAGKAVFGQV